MRTITTLAGLLALGGSSDAAAARPPGFRDYFGNWKVDKIAGAVSVTESRQSAAAAVGTTIRISAGLITTYDKHDACKPRDPMVTEVDTERVLESEFGVRMSDLYLPTGILAPRAAYLDVGCAFALVIDSNTLLWPMGNGYIYTVQRENP